MGVDNECAPPSGGIGGTVSNVGLLALHGMQLLHACYQDGSTIRRGEMGDGNGIGPIVRRSEFRNLLLWPLRPEAATSLG